MLPASRVLAALICRCLCAGVLRQHGHGHSGGYFKRKLPEQHPAWEALDRGHPRQRQLLISELLSARWAIPQHSHSPVQSRLGAHVLARPCCCVQVLFGHPARARRSRRGRSLAMQQEGPAAKKLPQLTQRKTAPLGLCILLHAESARSPVVSGGMLQGAASSKATAAAAATSSATTRGASARQQRLLSPGASLHRCPPLLCPRLGGPVQCLALC